jgi:hypothetical protein
MKLTSNISPSQTLQFKQKLPSLAKGFQKRENIFCIQRWAVSGDSPDPPTNYEHTMTHKLPSVTTPQETVDYIRARRFPTRAQCHRLTQGGTPLSRSHGFLPLRVVVSLLPPPINNQAIRVPFTHAQERRLCYSTSARTHTDTGAATSCRFSARHEAGGPGEAEEPGRGAERRQGRGRPRH